MSSSEQSDREEPELHSGDLPILQIPPELQTDSSSESDVPLTPDNSATPVDSTDNNLPSIGGSSQTSDEIDSVIPTSPFKAPKRVYSKRFPSRFQKGHQNVRHLKAETSSDKSPKPKRARIAVKRPSSSFFKGIKFPPAPVHQKVKIMNGKGVVREKETLVPVGNQIFNLQILSNIFSIFSCPDPNCCGRPKLYQHLVKDGLQRFYFLKCNKCHMCIAEFPATLPIGSSANEVVNNEFQMIRGKSEINSRSLLAVNTTSLSWADFQLLCSILDLPIPRRSQKSPKELADCTKRAVEKSMKQSAQEIRDSEIAVQSIVPGVISCSVSFDASWHQRGHCSNQGFAAVIESEKGKVLDYVLYERVCFHCSKWDQERKVKEPDEYTLFWNKHKDNCLANYRGSSQSMESSAAVEIWGRSVDLHQLHYTVYIGDGDSSSFKNLLKSDPYKGEVKIRKEECLGHVQKRFKGRLKKKDASTKGLPEAKADRLAHLYALVVVQNRGKTAEEIRKALQVLLMHTEEKHSSCPEGTSSWCYFQLELAQYAADETLPLPIPRQPYLTEPEIYTARNVLEVFSTLSLCQCLTLGKTQNANESLHSILWHNAPKTKRVGPISMQACTALAVLSFNHGSLAYSNVLAELGIPVSFNTLKHFSERDHNRNLTRINSQKTGQKQRRRRRDIQRKLAESSRKRQDGGKSYSSGQFGAEAQSEGEDSDTVCSECLLRDCPQNTTTKKDSWIDCENCEAWYHWKCVGSTMKNKNSMLFCKICLPHQDDD